MGATTAFRIPRAACRLRRGCPHVRGARETTRTTPGTHPA